MGYTVYVSDTKTTDVETEREVLSRVDATLDLVHARTPGDLIEAAADADALIVDAGTPVTREVFEALSGLRVVGRAGIGFDNVDVGAASDHGVTVVNVPDYCVEEVSTHALALLLACVRSVPAANRQVHDGEWDWEVCRPAHRLRDRTLGLLAFGKIGRRFAEKVEGFGLDRIAYDPYVDAGTMAEYGVEKVSFEDLLARSDLLSVHAPLTDETERMLDADALAALPEGAILVNTARGPIVDDRALYDALVGGHLRAAGLDVMPDEPPEGSPLLDCEDAVLSPHAAWYSEESRLDLSRSVAGDVARVLAGEAPRSAVDAESPWT
jgi:D-3-phosphoglycerate dehydrogenase